MEPRERLIAIAAGGAAATPLAIVGVYAFGWICEGECVQASSVLALWNLWATTGLYVGADIAAAALARWLAAGDPAKNEKGVGYSLLAAWAPFFLVHPDVQPLGLTGDSRAVIAWIILAAIHMVAGSMMATAMTEDMRDARRRAIADRNAHEQVGINQRLSGAPSRGGAGQLGDQRHTADDLEDDEDDLDWEEDDDTEAEPVTGAEASPELTYEVWASLARAIAGSGTYALEGNTHLQRERLIEWLRKGQGWGYGWRNLYTEIYRFRHSTSPHLPSVDEMETLLGARGDES